MYPSTLFCFSNVFSLWPHALQISERAPSDDRMIEGLDLDVIGDSRSHVTCSKRKNTEGDCEEARAGN